MPASATAKLKIQTSRACVSFSALEIILLILVTITTTTTTTTTAITTTAAAVVVVAPFLVYNESSHYSAAPTATDT